MKLAKEQVAELVTAVQLINSVQDDAARKIYGVQVSLGLGVAEVQMELHTFVETFPDYQMEELTCGDYPYQAHSVVGGVKFKSLVGNNDAALVLLNYSAQK